MENYLCLLRVLTIAPYRLHCLTLPLDTSRQGSVSLVRCDLWSYFLFAETYALEHALFGRLRFVFFIIINGLTRCVFVGYRNRSCFARVSPAAQLVISIALRVDTFACLVRPACVCEFQASPVGSAWHGA